MLYKALSSWYCLQKPSTVRNNVLSTFYTNDMGVMGCDSISCQSQLALDSQNARQQKNA